MSAFHPRLIRISPVLAILSTLAIVPSAPASVTNGTLPPPETALIDGDIAYREHSGGHTDVPNWPAFLEFAGHYIKGPGLKAASSANAGEKF